MIARWVCKFHLLWANRLVIRLPGAFTGVTLQTHLTKLYKQAGIKGGSSHSGRRTFANRVLEKTSDMDTVAQLLGNDSIDCTQRYLDVKPEILRDMFAIAV